MENGLLVGLSRQVALRRELDVVANNVANLNTTGYKADAIVFEEHLMPVARAGRFPLSDRALRFVQDRATWHDLGQGPVQHTGNPLDITLDGTAFLVVQTPRGERYTRNGALQINARGELVTTEGYQVMGQSGPIVFQPNDRDISVSADGSISVREGRNATIDAIRGKLRVVTFAQPQRLQKDSTTNFLAPGNMRPEQATNFRLVQGAIEKSNVKGVIEMTRLIDVTRTYTMVAGMLQQQSDLRRTAIEKLADVPA